MDLEELNVYVLNNQDKIKKSKPIYKGKSKIVYKINDDFCLIQLIPSLASYTYSRSEIIAETGKLRLDFFDIANKVLKENGVDSAYQFRVSDISYVSEICSNPPFEVIVKNRAVGSTQIKYPGLFKEKHKFVQPVVKFDYRVEPEDTPIAEDYIREYGLEPSLLKTIALNTNKVLSNWLSPLELYDFCIIIGVNANKEYKIISEISPDGMRLKSKEGKSYDKDIFRNGGSAAEIIEAWNSLIDFIKDKA